MANSPWLTLIVPGTGTALIHAAQPTHAGQPASQPAHAVQRQKSEHSQRDRTQLARMAGRGSLRYAWDRRDLALAALRPWQRGLLAALELPASGFPSAAVSASGSVDGNMDSQGSGWLHAEPVHFIAGLDRLSFLALQGEAAVSAVERAALEPMLAEHLRASSCELHSIESPAPAWLIAADRAFDAPNVMTACPDAAAANELERVMPRGPQAGALRRLMTELQMLLHEHPVNDARARRGLPAINALWLWGTGAIALLQSHKMLPPAFGDEPYLNGIYKLHGQSVQAVPGTCNELLCAIATAQRALAVVPVAEIDLLETQWIEPLRRALAAGAIDRVDLILDGWHLDASRASMRRFWRRPLPPAQWLVPELTEKSA